MPVSFYSLYEASELSKLWNNCILAVGIASPERSSPSLPLPFLLYPAPHFLHFDMQWRLIKIPRVGGGGGFSGSGEKSTPRAPPPGFWIKVPPPLNFKLLFQIQVIFMGWEKEDNWLFFKEVTFHPKGTSSQFNSRGDVPSVFQGGGRTSP